MTDRKLYGAFFGPYLYDDSELLNDSDGDFSGFCWDASISDGFHVCAGAKFLDSDQSHYLTVKWNEGDSAHRTLNLLVAGGDRSLTLSENLTLADGYDFTLQALGQANQLTLNENLTVADGYAVTLQALGQANQLVLNETLILADGYNLSLQALGQANAIVLNEDFTIGDGHAGTLTFSAASKILTIEDVSVVNQDLTTDTNPTFAGAILSGLSASQWVKTDGNKALESVQILCNNDEVVCCNDEVVTI